ncbi:acyl carrier protein [Pikeienuella piscinae]|uniref:Acyl carrier protein n=1 Tax=Pikeienuella piscinae TaxID=2748098 RepID=A0A7L5BWX4_9RHOB|nr:phosphopantetheine-binding protein [Pikeienuella piscinae]QIE54746.1 acyl carrier protein [Pikeienuella piscinae]
MTDETARKVIDIIAEQALLPSDEIRLDATPEELGLDSLALVEIVFAIEEGFDISVPFNANEPDASDFDISSVAKIVAAVKQLVAAKG